MSAESATIWAGLISGFLGGSLAAIGAMLAVYKGVKDLERTAIREQRVLCITNIYGYRYAISESEGFSARPEDKAHFMYEINKAGALFADDPEILNEIRDFYDKVKDKAPDANDRLIRLIKRMGQTTALNLDNLSDADVRKTFTLPGGNTVVQFIPVPVVQAPAPPNPPPTGPPHPHP